jgi:hypothetical protein
MRQRMAGDFYCTQAMDKLVLPEEIAMLEHFLPMNLGVLSEPRRTSFSF